MSSDPSNVKRGIPNWIVNAEAEGFGVDMQGNTIEFGGGGGGGTPSQGTSPFTIGSNLKLSQSGLTAPRTFTFPDLSDEVTTNTATETLTNKTIDYNSNTILNLPSGGTTIGPYDYIVDFDGTHYNAINGTTGVTTASNTSFSGLMSTLNTTLSSGGTILFKAATYHVDAAITLTHNISLIGDGRGQTIFLRTTLATTGSTFSFNGSNFTLARLTINGNYPTAQTNGSTFEVSIFNGGSDVICDDMEIINYAGQGALATDVIGMQITNCYITGPNNSSNGFLGIYTDPGTGQNAVTMISNCVFTGSSDNALFLSGKTTVMNCYFKGNAIASGGQILVSGAAGIAQTIMNNIFDAGGAGSSGIELSATGADVTIINNRISNQAKWGVVTDTGSTNESILITNNVIKNSQTGSGIQMQGAQTNFVITNNVCYDDQGTHTQVYGIYIGVTAAANNYIIEDNICYNNVTAQILDQGTGTTKFVANNIGYNPVVKGNASGYYFVFFDGTNYRCLNQKTGFVESTNTDAFTVIQYALSNGLNQKIVLDAGTYTLSSSLAVFQTQDFCGAGWQETILMAPTNAPCLTVTGTQASIHDISFQHNQTSYTSALLQPGLGSNKTLFYNLAFYDNGKNTGTAIQLNNTGANNAFDGIVFTTWNNIFILGFAVGINFNIANPTNYITGNNFSSIYIEGSTKGVTCTTPNGGGSTTNIDANNFQNIQMEAVVSGYANMTTGFDFTDAATHNYIQMTNVNVFDLQTSDTFMNVGTQTANYMLCACTPTNQANIGGSGANSALITRIGNGDAAFGGSITTIPNQHAGAYYFIFKDFFGNYCCLNQSTGVVESYLSDAATVINYAITNVGLKGWIYLEAGTYTLSTSILVNQPDIQIWGAGLQQTQLKANGNYPAVIVSTSYVVMHDLFLTQNTAGYSSSLLQFADGARVCFMDRFAFYDNGTNAGNAIQIVNNYAANADLGIFSLFFSNINTEGFQYAISQVINNTGNWLQNIYFSACFFDSCTKVLNCSGPSGSTIGSTFFMDSVSQYESSNPMTVAFDYSDSSDHPYVAHTNVIAFDLPAGVPYMKFGSQNPINSSFYLNGVIPSDDAHIQGAGAFAIINNNMYRALPYGSQLQASPLFGKWGAFQPAGNTGTLDGLLQQHTLVGTGGISTAFSAGQNVLGTNFGTGTTANANAGVVSPTTGVGIGRLSVRGRLRSICLNNSGSVSSSRFYFGVTSNTTLPISDSPLATTDSGIILGYNSTDTNWVVRTCNGGGTVTTTSLTNTVAKDLNFHTVEINWVAGATTVNVLLDNVLTTVSTTLPATTTNLFFNEVIQNSTTTQKFLFLQAAFIEMGG